MTTAQAATQTAMVATPAPIESLDARSLVEQLHRLRANAMNEFDWDRYCALMRQLCKAGHAAVVRRLTDSDNMEQLGRSSESETWSPLQALPPGIDLLSKSTINGYAHAPTQGQDRQTWLVLALPLTGLPSLFLILNIRMQERSQLNELTVRALLCTDFHAPRTSQPSHTTNSSLTGMLGLAAEVMQQRRFESACLSLVNGITNEWRLIQASLTWIEQNDLRVVAVSHLDRFEKSSRHVELISLAAEATAIQGHEVWWDESHTVQSTVMPMASYALEVGAQKVAGVPIRNAQGITQAVLLLAFPPSGEEAPDLSDLLLSLELIEPRLSDLHLQSLGLRARMARRLTTLSQQVFGPDHALLKLFGSLFAVILLYVVFGHWNYRVEASAQLNTEATRLISAQFDSRIAQVYTTAGELVKQGALLVSLDTRELEQQQSELSAELVKVQTEVNKFRADARLAETEIAQAKLEQVQAKSKRIELYLQQSQERAPFDGVVVEGERKDLTGAPVKKGDKIFRLSKIEGLYVTLMVAERQMRHIRVGATGEVALLSHPDHNIPIRVNSVIPVAQVKGQEGNQFMITAEMLQAPQPWWRPGMTGLARIDVGDRNIAWILTHRVIDNLRLTFWW